MNILILINYAIFAVLLSLFFLELGAAILSLVDYETYRERVFTYVAPIWEITGTMSIFFIVNLIATYPSLVPTLDLYIAPVLLGAVFLIVRDAFLGYSEFADRQDAKREARVYSVCTLVIALLIVLVAGSLLSGAGLGPSTNSLDLVALINPFSIGLFLSVFLFVAFLTPIFYNIRSAKFAIASIIVSVWLFAADLNNYVPYVVANIAAEWYLSLPSAALLVAMLYLYLKRDKMAKFLVLPFSISCVGAVELFSYPCLANCSIALTSYLAPSVDQPYILAITVAGSVFLAVALGIFVYVHHVHKKRVAKKY